MKQLQTKDGLGMIVFHVAMPVRILDVSYRYWGHESNGRYVTSCSYYWDQDGVCVAMDVSGAIITGESLEQYNLNKGDLEVAINAEG